MDGVHIVKVEIAAESGIVAVDVAAVIGIECRVVLILRACKVNPRSNSPSVMVNANTTEISMAIAQIYPRAVISLILCYMAVNYLSLPLTAHFTNSYPTSGIPVI
ncbi:hypothetical protein DSECCO2_557330 [anaerobic digester metagenome]